ncbi:DUF1145 domain-containing protein [Colwellia sp. MB02u-6]|uniref:DUF1145 domain-containing protein n=1 Tax=Colwellia sp. MB02u-6 TaxID=2759824 RepID=UPI0015F3F235|nr:DUF1145 domain-containing protein [Colwellia sp. MB02u-6]MBA6327056.1 DUF1145 domain-containing protein [Colwellia sp. MB02u-6]
MLNFVIYSLKALLTGLWALAIIAVLSLSPLPTDYQFYALTSAGVALLVHFIKFFTTKAKFKKQRGLAMNFVQTMLWGFGYWLPTFKAV